MRGLFPSHTSAFMTTTHIANVTLDTQANVYFDGKCVSHGFQQADGRRASVGVILPATLTFNTGAAEVMECVAGGCEYGLGFAAALARGNLFAVQFHPEKSHTAGLQLLANFVAWNGRALECAC